MCLIRKKQMNTARKKKHDARGKRGKHQNGAKRGKIEATRLVIGQKYNSCVLIG